MDESKSLKILVSGDVDGKLADLYAKVKTIQSKAGKFDLLICVGEFFSVDDNSQVEQILADPASIPILTYVLGSNDENRVKNFKDPQGYDIVRDKILYLGTKGLYMTSHGLSIVYLSGTEDNNSKGESNEVRQFNEKDVENLINNFEKKDLQCVDILLTNQWPKYVENNCDQKLDNGKCTDRFGSELISYLATKLRPRYHFTAIENIFFERIPYRNHSVAQEKDKNITRFISLAKVNKTNKPKFLYAFNMVPAKKTSLRDLNAQNVAQITDHPYLQKLDAKYRSGIKRSQTQEQEDEASLQYFYDADHIKKINMQQERYQNEKRRRIEERERREQEPCWFCLGGTKIEPHFIVSVGEKCYLAYAKGALNKDNLLIISIDHVQSSIHADQSLLDEINKYKIALRKYFRSKNKCVLFYERNFRTKHMQIQVYAINADKSYLLKDAFESGSKDQSIRLNQIPEFTNLGQVLEPRNSFFYLELPVDDLDDQSLEKSERFLCEIRGNNFPLHFGRDVMASEVLLNMPNRINWKDCLLTQDEEKKMSLEFRENFKPFDPSL